MKSFSAQAVSRWSHIAAIALMAMFVFAATGVGFAQSWAGLYGWAIGHGLAGWKAASFPAMVDLFILVGELGLFTLSLEGVSRKTGWASYVLPVAVTVAGWTVSLVFNVGHVDDRLSDRFTAAVPPVASMVGLFLLLQTLHRQVVRAQAPKVVAPGTAASAIDEREPAEGVVMSTTPDPFGELSGSQDFGHPVEAEPGELAAPSEVEIDRAGAVEAKAAQPSAGRKRRTPDGRGTKPAIPIDEVMTAHRGGESSRTIAARLGTTRYQVQKVIRENQSLEPARLEAVG